MTPAETLSPLSAKSCFIVEDEPLIAMTLKDMVVDLDASGAIIASRLEKGMEIARTAIIDIAFLDINLGDQMSYPIAKILKERGIPFMFTTSYGPEAVENDYAAPILHKPYDEVSLERASARLLQNNRQK